MDKQSKESIFAGRFWRSKYLFRDFPGGPQNFWNLERVFPSKREKELLFLPSNDICCKSTGWPRPCLVHPALQVVGGPCHEVHRLYLQPQSDLVVLWLFEWWMMTKLLEYWRKVRVMVMMVMMMMMNPAPPSGVSAKAMLTGEEYFPASFFCLRASSSWNDDIFDTDSFLRHKMIHLLRSLSLLPHWNLLIFLTCKSKYKNQRTWWVYFEKIYNLLQFIWCFISDIISKNAMYNWLNRLCLLYGKSHSMTKPMDVTFCNLPGFCQSTLAKAIQWQIPDTLTFAM